MPIDQFTPPKNLIRAAFFYTGSSLVTLGERLMKRFSDPTPEPPPEPPAPVIEVQPEKEEGFHLELELSSDPEIPRADPARTITHQIVLNITAWRPDPNNFEPQASTRFEAYSDKLIHLAPYTINIERGRMTAMDGVVIGVAEEE